MFSVLVVASMYALPEVWTDFNHEDFSLVYDEAVFSSVTDHLMRLQYNDNSMPWYDSSMVSFGLQLESRYYSSSTETTASEIVFSFDNNDGVYIRPLQMSYEWETESSWIRSEGRFEFRSSDGREGWRFTEDLKLLAIDGILANRNSGEQWIYQEDSDNIERSLIYREGRRVLLGELGDSVHTFDDLAIGYASTPSSLLHFQPTKDSSGAWYTPIRLTPYITTDNDVSGTWSRMSVNVADNALVSNIKGYWLSPPNITLGSDASVHRVDTLFIDGAATEGTKNHALYVNGGGALSVVKGTLEVGTLKIGDTADCVHFDEDTCFLIQDGHGGQYEVPAHPLP